MFYDYYQKIFLSSLPIKECIIEDDTIKIKVPGFNKDTLTIEVEDRYLYIRGENGSEKLEKTFLLPSTLSTDNVLASVADGLLSIRFESKNSRKKIQIK